MYDLEQVKELFGDQVLQYLLNKNRGGTSGLKGNTYENFFAVYQLALLARDVIEANQEIYFSSQILAFVDDLIIDCCDKPLCHFQLKNSQDVTWGSGTKSISDDFQKQFELNQAVSRSSDLGLVVSTQELCSYLEAALPENLKECSRVLYFPFATSLSKVVAQESSFYEAIKYLSAFEQPEPDKIECVANALLGAWVACDSSRLSAMELLKKAQAVSPSYIRSFEQYWALEPEVKAILDKIANFSYNLAKGFFHWSFANGLEEGTLPYSIDSANFRRFQDRVKLNNPTSFEKLEVLL
jgi:hypothetical protein